MLDQTNRQQFLANLAKAFGREVRYEVQGEYKHSCNYPKERLTELDEAERFSQFLATSEAMLAQTVLTTKAEAARSLLTLCRELPKYEGKETIIINDDPRLAQYQLAATLQHEFQVDLWSDNAEQNIKQANHANIGIVFADYGLVESGGVVLFSGKGLGRSVSLLPPVSIVLLNRSTILPRVAQLSEILHAKAAQGERMPSCINIISGPSATADIELVKVVGVHGPIKKIYVIIEDA